MHLFDPKRNFLPNGHKTWLRSDVALKNPTIKPLENKNYELSMFLPVREEIFTSKEFKIEVSPDQLLILLEEFTNDPENFVEKYFTSEDENLSPEVRRRAKQKEPSETSTNTSTNKKLNPSHPKLEDLNF